ncbi:hypothetical protein QCA50_014382 [Cerrena zonata]|uniref:Uncharacterized protein n=1 Tax=Cerrena zonata TaxID=2478898 RepID=A0AAW0FR78_9APHY
MYSGKLRHTLPSRSSLVYISKLHTDFTVMESSVLWVPGCSTRGSSDILTLCLSTIIICAWSAFHDDIPRTRPENRRLVPYMRESIIWMVVFLLLPETLPSAALEQLREAYIISRNMKGIHRNHPWTFTHSFYATLGGYAFDYELPDSTYRYHFNIRGFLILVEEKPALLPEISEESIVSRSQRNSLTKIVAVVQVLSFCTTCALRRSEKLSLSILEISTIGYAFCAILAYAMWWKKPCITAEPTLVKITSSDTIFDRLCDIPGSVAPETHVRVSFGTAEGDESSTKSANSTDEERPATSSVHSRNVESSAEWGRNFQIVSWSVISVMHGLIHLFAWHVHFPTYIECVIWRVCTVLAILLGSIAVNFIHILTNNGQTSLRTIKVSEIPKAWLYIIVLLVYALVRLIMIAEIARQFLYLPPDAFQVASWSQYLPRFT